ncbi:MAG: ABC transporter substrate-binding protein, partial [Rhodospirillaceae bacterium]|nr:ABC transporter substrate-binding protein [Rhodospirillaceae bacterium]
AFMKFYEAAKFYYYPGMHEPGAMLALGLNASFWSKLSKADQTIIEAAAAAENDWMMSEYNAKSGAALIDLVTNQGVQLRQFSDDIYDSFSDAAEEVFEEVRAHSDLSNRIYESFITSRANVGAWTNISDQAYVAQRNRVLGL